MASEDLVERLTSIRDAIRELERDKLYRPNLGEEAFTETLGPKLELLLSRADFAVEYALNVPNEQVDGIITQLDSVRDQLSKVAELPAQQFIGAKVGVLTNLDNRIESIKTYWPPFVTAAIEARGVLSDEGIREASLQAIQTVKHETAAALENLKEHMREMLEVARADASEIEGRARRTARNVSNEDVQAQFRAGVAHHDTQISLWTKLSGASMAVFVSFFALVWFDDPGSPGTVLYHTAIRFAMLIALGTVMAFCIRTLKAHMHMKELNLHRARVANCIPSLVDSALNSDQRDSILATLVDSLVAFGNSGLLSSHDSSSPNKLAIESVLKTFTPQDKG